MHKRHFTLVELMAAMVVLVIMMGFLFKFITSSQDLWSASERNSRVYENAQIFFELVDRDLGGAMVNDIPGQEISFWIGDPDSTEKDFLTMVSTMPPPDESVPDVCEVHYKLFPTSSSTIFVLKRAVVAQKKWDNSDPPVLVLDPDWDFYGQDTASTAWIGNDGGDWQEVIDGIETITMECYGADGTAMTPPKSYPDLPTAVKFTITLVDQKVVDLGLSGSALDDRLAASRRQFTRVVFLNR